MQMIDDKFIEKIFSNDRRTVARSISIVESDNSMAIELLKKVYGRVGNAYRIGITGPPGAGKSTITNQLTKFYRKQGKTVGIIDSVERRKRGERRDFKWMQLGFGSIHEEMDKSNERL